jgi:hypothetical protein
MDRLVLTARLRLLSVRDGGRGTPISSDYRPVFDVGASWLGRPTLNDGRLTLLERETLAPGNEARVRVVPVRPEFWAGLRHGQVIPVQEGAHVVGQATIETAAFLGGFTPAIAAFVCAASEYCAFIEEAAMLSVADRMFVARHYLLALVAAAIRLPLPEVPGSAPTTDVAPPANWRGFDPFEIYWDVFDPYELSEPVAGSLSDDLLDVYRDLRRGLALWEAGKDGGAVWEWRFHFDAHWGNHATDALRALHRACAKAKR